MTAIEQALQELNQGGDGAKAAENGAAGIFGMCKLVGAHAEVEDSPRGFNWFLLTCTEGAPGEICATVTGASGSSAWGFVEVFPGQDHEERWGAAVSSVSASASSPSSLGDVTSPQSGDVLTLSLIPGEGDGASEMPREVSLEWIVDSLELLTADKMADLRSMLTQRPMLLDPVDSEDHGVPLESIADDAPLAELRDMLECAALNAHWVTFEGWQQPEGHGARLHATYTVAPSGTGVVIAPVGVEQEEGGEEDEQEVRALVGLYANGELLTVASSDGDMRIFEVVTVRNARIVDAQEAPEIF